MLHIGDSARAGVEGHRDLILSKTFNSIDDLMQGIHRSVERTKARTYFYVESRVPSLKFDDVKSYIDKVFFQQYCWPTCCTSTCR